MNSVPVSIDVWLWSLDLEPRELEAVSALLSADEEARARRLVKLQDRQRWIASRGRMRQILGRALRVAPTEIAFATEPHGRPILAHTASPLPSFNLSHAEGMAALAVSWDARVGVDIECLRPLTADEMAWPLSAAERESLAKFEEPERTKWFFRYWTLKEAFIKTVGKGVSLPLEDFDISPPNDGPPRLLRLVSAPGDIDRWRFAEHEPANGYRAAVGALTEGRGIRVAWHNEC